MSRASTPGFDGLSDFDFDAVDLEGLGNSRPVEGWFAVAIMHMYHALTILQATYCPVSRPN